MNHGTKDLTLPITGMTCEHCVATVRQAIEAVPGVVSARVDLAAGQAQVSLDPARVDQTDLVEAVEAAGYGASDASTSEPTPSPRLVTIGGLAPADPVAARPPAPAAEERQEWNLAVEGMHCAGCVSRVENALRSVPGIREARVNLATDRAHST